MTQKTRRCRRSLPPPHNDPPPPQADPCRRRIQENPRNFLRLRRFGYIDHYYHDHGYLDIDNKGYVYSNSSATTPVNSVRVVTCVPDTPAVTAGGKRGETIRDTVDDGGEKEATEAQDFKSSRKRPLHSRYD